MGLLDSAKPVGEFPDWLHAAIYGPPGVGKTVLGASACSEGKVLHLDIDGTGAKSIKNHPNYLPHVDRIRARTASDLMGVGVDLRRGGHEYRTVLLDTFSELQRKDAADIARKEFADNPQKRERYKNWQEDWNENTNRMREVIEFYCELDMHVLFLFHILKEKDQSGMTFIRPAITPKLGGTIATLMDITGYYTLDVKPDGSEVRELRVKPTKVIEAKTRNWFPKPVLIDPVFKDLLPPKKKEEAA